MDNNSVWLFTLFYSRAELILSSHALRLDGGLCFACFRDSLAGLTYGLSSDGFGGDE